MSLTVSVIIPCYNGAAFLREALESVLAQTYAACEVLVIDDGSTDDSVEVAESFGHAVRVIRLEGNSGGPAKPINVGVRATRGEVIAVLDQDDLFSKQKLETEVDALRQSPAAHFAFSVCGRMADGRPHDKVHLPHRRMRDFISRSAPELKPVGGSELFVRLARHGNILVGFPGFTFRRSLWEQLGGLNESMSCAADLDFLCRACSMGDTVSTQRIGYFKRDHASNHSKRNIHSRVDCIRTFAAFRSHPDPTIRNAAQKAVNRWSRDFENCLSAAGFWKASLGIYRARRGPTALPAPLSVGMLYWTYCQITGQQWHISKDDATDTSGIVCQHLQSQHN